MNKQELIHLHGLMSQIRIHYEEETGETVDLSEYLERSVAPNSIQSSAGKHKAALMDLASSISQEIEEPGSTEAGSDLLYETVLEEAVEQYDRRSDVSDQSYVAVMPRKVGLTKAQAQRLAENFPLVYGETSVGSIRLKVPEEEAEDWADETAKQLDS